MSERRQPAALQRRIHVLLSPQAAAALDYLLRRQADAYARGGTDRAPSRSGLLNELIILAARNAGWAPEGG